MRQMNCRINGTSIRQYSTTFLLLGSMASSAHVRAVTDFYPIQPNTEALKQSMIAEFALAYDDIPTAIHNLSLIHI